MRTRNSRGRFIANPPVDARDEAKAAKVEALIHKGPLTFVLVYADWCGHCTRYKPTWKALEKTPGRKANIVSVRDDMLSKVPTIANAKLQGYPSVIKVSPTGQMEEYKVPGELEPTNAMPDMRDTKLMKKELTTGVSTGATTNAPVAPVAPVASDSGSPGIQAGILGHQDILAKDVIVGQKGGFADSVMGTLMSAIQKAGPAALLLLANGIVTRRKHKKTFKSPKRSSRHGSTRKQRRH